MKNTTPEILETELPDYASTVHADAAQTYFKCPELADLLEAPISQPLDRAGTDQDPDADPDADPDTASGRDFAGRAATRPSAGMLPAQPTVVTFRPAEPGTLS